MGLDAFCDALDRAIAKVANREFERLCYKMTVPEISARVYDSVECFRNLRSGRPPAYDDPWISLFYLTWYQPGQIQMARNLIHEYKELRGNSTLVNASCPHLRVIDFGCGALAMQFAVAWAVADAIDNQERISSVRIDSYDSSASMVRLGKALWSQFKEEVGVEDSLAQWHKVIEMIDSPYAMPNFLNESEEPKEDRWLTAIHAIYRSNVALVNDNLSKLYATFEPHTLLMSVHNDVSQRNELQQVAKHVLGEHERFSQIKLLSSGTSGAPNSFYRVTNWRFGLNSRIDKPHDYLKSDVSSWFSDAAGLIISRKN